MDKFRIVKERDNVYSILDEAGCSFYVVIGNKRSAVIDTGITVNERILPVITKLTTKPLSLIVTHAHLDHMHHIDEFETVYMSHDELKLDKDILHQVTGGMESYLGNTIDITTDSEIDLGDYILSICKVPGHTPGSVVVLDEKNNMLFTGDAIGSGASAFLQIVGTTTLDVYYQSLLTLMKWLINKGGRMTFWGGHNHQIFESSLIPNFNPLNMGLLADLIDLVDGIIQGTIVGRPSNAQGTTSMDIALYASYGRAELQYNPKTIHLR